MEKSNFKLFGSTMLHTTTVCLTVLVLCFSSCKQEAKHDIKPVTSIKTAAATSGQPRPGGKLRFSLSIGRFVNTGAVWVRMVNWTFNDVAGTVDATFWQWDSVAEKGKTVYSSHTCTMDNLTKTCNTYTPTGWLLPGGQWAGMTGNYTYNASTGALHIDWPGGTSENWKVTNPTTSIARIAFVSSAGSGYAVTHGAGYGSNAPWPNGTGTDAGVAYATIAQIPRVPYYGKHVLINKDKDGVYTYSLNALSGAWASRSMDISSATTPSNPSPANVLHFYTKSGTAVAGKGGCVTNRPGHIYHLAGNNLGRSMSWSHWAACLVLNGTTSAHFPCYVGQMHPYAFQQIIDDSGAMKGFIGIEQQDQSPSPGFEYQLVDYSLIP